MFKQDWTMWQVEGMLLAVSRLVFQKEAADYTPTGKARDALADGLCLELRALIAQGQLNDAENFLFERVDLTDKRYLEVAMDFYAKLNHLSERELNESDFSREEIGEGLKDIIEQFDLTLP